MAEETEAMQDTPDHQHRSPESCKGSNTVNVNSSSSSSSCSSKPNGPCMEVSDGAGGALTGADSATAATEDMLLMEDVRKVVGVLLSKVFAGQPLERACMGVVLSRESVGKTHPVHERALNTGFILLDGMGIFQELQENSQHDVTRYMYRGFGHLDEKFKRLSLTAPKFVKYLDAVAAAVGVVNDSGPITTSGKALLTSSPPRTVLVKANRSGSLDPKHDPPAEIFSSRGILDATIMCLMASPVALRLEDVVAKLAWLAAKEGFAGDIGTRYIKQFVADSVQMFLALGLVRDASVPGLDNTGTRIPNKITWTGDGAVHDEQADEESKFVGTGRGVKCARIPFATDDSDAFLHWDPRLERPVTLFDREKSHADARLGKASPAAAAVEGRAPGEKRKKKKKKDKKIKTNKRHRGERC